MRRKRFAANFGGARSNALDTMIGRGGAVVGKVRSNS